MSRRVKETLKENNELEKQLSDEGKKVLVFIRDTLPALIVLLMTWCAGCLAEVLAGMLPSFNCPVTLGNLVGGILLLAGTEGLITLLTKHAFESSRSFNKKWGAVLVVVFIAAVCANCLITYKVFSIHLGLTAVLTLAAFVGYRILDSNID